MKILLPTTLDEAPALPDGVEAVTYDAHAPIPAEHRDAEALVAWANGPGVLEDAASLPNLRWVQNLAAGADALHAAGFADDVVLTGGVGLHDRPVAEHALALLLALVRRLPECREAQLAHRWDPELGGPKPLRTEPVTTLLGTNVLVWGFGSIAQTLAPLLTSLGANVRGAARSAGERGGYDVVGEQGLDEALTWADVLVVILPGGEATRHALSAQRLARLPKHAYVVNVGRGTAIDEAALVDALRAGSIAGAGLDVTEVEPLPADSPTWDAPNLVITPHGAGGRPVGYDELIAANARALLAGEQMRNVIERS